MYIKKYMIDRLFLAGNFLDVFNFNLEDQLRIFFNLFLFVFLLEGGVCIKRLEDEPCPKAGGWYLTLLKSCWRSSVIVISPQGVSITPVLDISHVMSLASVSLLYSQCLQLSFEPI